MTGLIWEAKVERVSSQIDLLVVASERRAAVLPTSWTLGYRGHHRVLRSVPLAPN
jgi:hypothetical protein